MPPSSPRLWGAQVLALQRKGAAGFIIRLWQSFVAQPGNSLLAPRDAGDVAAMMQEEPDLSLRTIVAAVACGYIAQDATVWDVQLAPLISVAGPPSAFQFCRDFIRLLQRWRTDQFSSEGLGRLLLHVSPFNDQLGRNSSASYLGNLCATVALRFLGPLFAQRQLRPESEAEFSFICAYAAQSVPDALLVSYAGPHQDLRRLIDVALFWANDVRPTIVPFLILDPVFHNDCRIRVFQQREDIGRSADYLDALREAYPTDQHVLLNILKGIAGSQYQPEHAQCIVRFVEQLGGLSGAHVLLNY